jgi:hypothetical protein
VRAGDEIAEMRRQVNQILNAAKAVVPQEMWGAIAEKLDQVERHPEAIDVGTDSFDDADDAPYDPKEFIDEDDEF